MYLLNAALKVNWVLGANVNTIVRGDLDVVVVEPDGVTTNNVGAITAANYSAYTSNTNGYAAYDFTPDKLGTWTVILNNDMSNANHIYEEHKIVVSVNDTYIEKFVDMTNF